MLLLLTNTTACGLPFMKNRLRRHYGRKDLHFITFSCYER
jgi:hypothetical protein